MLDVYGAREDPEPGVTGELVARVVPLPPNASRSNPTRRRGLAGKMEPRNNGNGNRKQKRGQNAEVHCVARDRRTQSFVISLPRQRPRRWSSDDLRTHQGPH